MLHVLAILEPCNGLDRVSFVLAGEHSWSSKVDGLSCRLNGSFEGSSHR